jgi:2-oxoisovalerate dehydrogenase E1 component beta subunit
MRRIARRVATTATSVTGAVRHKHVPRPSPLTGDEAVAGENGISMNLFTAINSAMDVSLQRDEKCVTFGEDVGFGGVFRCSMDLRDKHGAHRVFNAPLTEQGIAGFGIGMAAVGWHPIVEIQFADYIFPAFDQIVNEAAKFRYRTGGQFDCGGVTFRAPCSAVGHGGLYHSQSVEGYFAHTPGIKVVMPSTPQEAKGLLLACHQDEDPCLVLEPKILYRTAIEDVNPGHYTIPIGKARTVREGKDLTIVTYGAQVNVALLAADELAKDGIEVDLIDLRSIVPWDREAVYASVKKTGRVIVTHEAPITCGFGAELVASLTNECFLHLEAPPTRVCGLDTPFPLHEKLYLPNERKLVEAAKKLVKF